MAWYEKLDSKIDGEKFVVTDENRKIQNGEYFSSNKKALYRMLDETHSDAQGRYWVVKAIEEMAAAQDNANFRAEWYMSQESIEGPFAATPDETLWRNDNTVQTERQATRRAQGWQMQEDSYKTARVVRVNAEGNAVEVVWMSVWDKQDTQEVGSPPGVPGESLKMLVWAPRDWHHPDHWGWMHMMDGLGLNANQWDLIYARKVDTKGKEICWSIRFNAWHNLDPIVEWDWHDIIGTYPGKIEVVRSVSVPARNFPEGVETVKCSYCEKKIEKAKAWESYHPNLEDLVPFCSCWCIDDVWAKEGMEETGNNCWRVDPDGIETEDPGCVALREILNSV